MASCLGAAEVGVSYKWLCGELPGRGEYGASRSQCFTETAAEACTLSRLRGAVDLGKRRSLIFGFFVEMGFGMLSGC